MAEFDFSSVTADAVAQLEGTSPAGATSTEPAEAPPSLDASPDQEAAAQAAAPEAPVLPTITITHRGKEVVIENPTLEQVKEYVQKGYDYTVKTTELSQRDRARVEEIARYKSSLEQRIQQYEAALAQRLQDEQWLAERLEATRAQRGGQVQAAGYQPQAGLAPDDIPSGQQVLDLIRQQQAQIQRLVAEQGQRTKAETSAEVMQAIEQAVLTTQYAQDVEGHIAALQRQFPEVAAIEGQDFVPDLKAKMSSFIKANNIDDLGAAKMAMTEFVAKKAERLRASFTQREKQAVVQQARNQTTAIIPPGGQPTTSTASATAGLKWGDPRIGQMVAEALTRGGSL